MPAGRQRSPAQPVRGKVMTRSIRSGATGRHSSGVSGITNHHSRRWLQDPFQGVAPGSGTYLARTVIQATTILASSLLIFSSQLWINPVLGGLLKVQSVCGGGGGSFRASSPTRSRKLRYLATSDSLNDRSKLNPNRPLRDLNLLSRPFSGQVNIEVTRGHQRSNFVKIAIFS